jgi:hypothetical protein
MRRLLHALLRQLAGQHGAAGSVVCASGGASVGCEVGHQRENTGTRTAALLQSCYSIEIALFPNPRVGHGPSGHPAGSAHGLC